MESMPSPVEPTPGASLLRLHDASSDARWKFMDTIIGYNVIVCNNYMENDVPPK